MGNDKRLPIDQLKYGIKGQRDRDPKKLREYIGKHPTLNIDSLISEYEDGYVIYRDPKTYCFQPGNQTWGSRKGRRGGKNIVQLIDQIADENTWIAMLLKHFMLTDHKDAEVSLRAMQSLLDRYFGKPMQNQSIEIASPNAEAIKSKLNDMFGINDSQSSLGSEEEPTSTDSTNNSEGNDEDQPGAD